MLLYHGTKESILPEIMTGGIRPRAECSEGNHAGSYAELKSRDGTVYLSSVCPIQYARGAKGDGRLLIVELDLDRLQEEKMTPDEDALVHSILQKEGVPRNTPQYYRRFIELLPMANPEAERNRWKELLELGGSVGHSGPIPPDRIGRYALVDPDRSKKFFEFFDAMIFAMNAGFRMTDRLKALSSYVFDGEVEPLLGGIQHNGVAEIDAELRKEWPTSTTIVTVEIN